MPVKNPTGLACSTLPETVQLSRRVENEETDLSNLIDDARLLAEEVVWAVDQPGGSAALLLALLWERDQKVLYVPGLTVDRARDAYRGESKTDARLIADQARMRPDLGQLKPGEQEIAELQLLLARRRDLITATKPEPSLASERGACVFVSGFGAGFGSGQQRSPHPPHSLPDSGPAQTSRPQAPRRSPQRLPQKPWRQRVQ
jgi:hypothetical protein